MSQISNNLSGRYVGTQRMTISEMKASFDLEEKLKKDIEKNYELGYLKFVGDPINGIEDNMEIDFKAKRHFAITKLAIKDRRLIIKKKKQYVPKDSNIGRVARRKKYLEDVYKSMEGKKHEQKTA